MIYIKKNNLNTRYKNLVISANVILSSRNINTSEPLCSTQRLVYDLRYNKPNQLIMKKNIKSFIQKYNLDDIISIDGSSINIGLHPNKGI
jgi:hypothetical protein